MAAVLGLVVGMAGNCVPFAGTELPETRGEPKRSAEIRLYSPHTARAVGATLPVLVEVDLDASSDPGSRCVALRGDPGTASFVFPEACIAAAGATAGAGGAGDQDQPAAVVDATTCMTFEQNGTVNAWQGSTLGAYHPAASEGVVTLFAAVYPTERCEGPTADENTLVIHLEERAAEGGAGGEGNAAGGMQAGGAGGEPNAEGGSAGTPSTGGSAGSVGGAGGSAGETSGGTSGVAGDASGGGG